MPIREQLGQYQGGQFLFQPIDATKSFVNKRAFTSVGGTYKEFKRNLESFLPLFPSMNQTASNCLYHNEGIKRNANAVMRICQRSPASHSLEPQYEYTRGQQYCHYLEPDMDAQRHPRVPMVEACHKNGSRDHEEKGDGCYYAVAFDNALVPGHIAKAVAHSCSTVRICVNPFIFGSLTIVLQCRKI